MKRKTWQDVEHGAAGFIFALRNYDVPGVAIVKPPPDSGSEFAFEAHRRVTTWLTENEVPAVDPRTAADELFARVS